MVPYEPINTQRFSTGDLYVPEMLALMPLVSVYPPEKTGEPGGLQCPFLAFDDEDDEEDDIDEEDNFDDMEDDFEDDFEDDDDDDDFEDDYEDGDDDYDDDYEEDGEYDDFDE